MGTHPIFESDFDCLTENSDKKQSVMPCARSMVQSKTFVTPSRCYEKARLDQELKLVGEFGLRNKREVWRVKLAVAKDRKRLFEGNALLRRLVRIGVLPEDQMKLDYVLGLKIENFLERRLQT